MSQHWLLENLSVANSQSELAVDEPVLGPEQRISSRNKVQTNKLSIQPNSESWILVCVTVLSLILLTRQLSRQTE
jgi:hypothetical protein